MVAIKVAGEEKLVPASSKVNGDDYDINPTTGNVCEPVMSLPGGRVIYSDDLKKGGDGRTWARTTKQAAEEDMKRGIKPKWLTESARANRTYFTPTETYKNEYERIFGHG